MAQAASVSGAVNSRAVISGAAIAWFLAAAPSKAQSPLIELRAEDPSAVSATLYRDPYRASGSIDLDRLAGFALITETRLVHLQKGENRLRFEGVADGIEPESAIVTGLDEGIVEKNRDAAVLSPAALVAAALGKPLVLVRTSPKCGRVERVPGTVLSDAEGGVIFRSDEGIEALRCSGLRETLSFEGTQGLRAHATLSVKVRAQHELSATATLSYLSHGFDWAADYTATLSADGRTLDLGAWVTLANANGTGFPETRTQLVAGRVNRETGDVEPLDIGGPIVANCWPRGSTSDTPMPLQLGFGPREFRERAITQAVAAPVPTTLADVMASGQRVQQERLGDLKLYRIQEPTTLAGRESKQVRLFDRSAIPVATMYGIELGGDAAPGEPAGRVSASRYLRTRNTEANRLGIPLPSGRVQVFGIRGGRRLVEHEANLRDLAVNEEVEIDLGPSPDVQVEAAGTGDSHRIEISNARAAPIQFELKLRLRDGARVARADRKVETKNGRPIFKFTVPAQSAVSVRYETAGAADRPVVKPSHSASP